MKPDVIVRIVSCSDQHGRQGGETHDRSSRPEVFAQQNRLDGRPGYDGGGKDHCERGDRRGETTLVEGTGEFERQTSAALEMTGHRLGPESTARSKFSAVRWLGAGTYTLAKSTLSNLDPELVARSPTVGRQSWNVGAVCSPSWDESGALAGGTAHLLVHGGAVGKVEHGEEVHVALGRAGPGLGDEGVLRRERAASLSAVSRRRTYTQGPHLNWGAIAVSTMDTL